MKTAKAKDIKESGARSRPTSPVGFSEYIPKEKYDDGSCEFSVFKKNPRLLKKLLSSSSDISKKRFYITLWSK